MPDQAPISLHTTIELSTETDWQKTRERCPTIHFCTEDGTRFASFTTDNERPRLPLPDTSVASIDLDRVVARVIDEEAWLRECRRILVPVGEIRFTVPADGPLAWIDARNTYRYAVDIIGRGQEPDDTLPTGWHRHYKRSDIERMLDTAGLKAASIRRVGTGLPEIPQLAGLVVGNMLLGQRDTERRLHSLRSRMERRDDQRPVPLLGSSFTVTARTSIR
ncbi:MAG TPA: hypothetical protein VNZ58_13240 [Thermomicrobiales bacterium]|nr:hypothetical protein [Thermomicrobiales bacterium]